MDTNELVGVMYLLVAVLYFVMGTITIRQKRVPTLGKKTVTGQRAVTVGYVMGSTGILMLIAVIYTTFTVSQGQRASYFFASLIMFGGVLALYLLRPPSAQLTDVENSKHKRQPLPEVLTVSEAAHYLRVEEVYILHLIEDGELKAKAIGGDYRISKAELQKFLQS